MEINQNDYQTNEFKNNNYEPKENRKATFQEPINWNLGEKNLYKNVIEEE